MAVEEAHAARAADLVADTLAGGLVEEDDVGAVRAHTGAVVEDERLPQRDRRASLVLLVPVCRP